MGRLAEWVLADTDDDFLHGLRVQVRVSGLAGLAVGASLVFEFERDGERREGVILRHERRWFAFHNRCPHWGVDLDMGERRFYSGLTDKVFCSSHGALFEIGSGYCVLGPCVGSSLEVFGLRVDGDEAVVEITDIDPDPRW